jgi:thiamine transport system permease protein
MWKPMTNSFAIAKWLAPFFVVTCVAVGLVPLLLYAWQQGGVVLPDGYVWRVLRFTLLQATLSTMFSIIPAVLVARALSRRRFWGRNYLITLLAVPLSLPVIVAIFGMTAVYGAAGVFGGWIDLYSLQGIVLAHVFFNLPLATRLLLENLSSPPAEGHRLAAQLQFSDAAVFQHVDWPVLQPALPRVAALVFLLCAGSFVIVLLFGGPQATTLEVAIYQSLRLDFDVSRALTLTLLQVCLSALLVWAASKTLLRIEMVKTNAMSAARYDGKSGLARIIDFSSLFALTALVAPILISILTQGVLHLKLTTLMVQATLTSLGIALLSCSLALPLAWAFAHAMMRLPTRQGLLTALSLASYVVPPAVLATGWFLAFRNLDVGIVLAAALIAAMNALMALPFLMTVLTPAVEQAALQHDPLCAQLNIWGWTRFRVIDYPALRSPIAQCVLMTVVLSMGDLTAVTLLGAQGLVTLPALVQQQMGHYQSSDAGGTALVLMAICLGTTFFAQRFGRWT